jgi:hypothetical protein
MIHVLSALHDRVDARHGRIQPVTSSQVGGDMFDVAALVATSASAEDADTGAGCVELIDDDPAQDTGAADHEYAFRHTLWTG